MGKRGRKKRRAKGGERPSRSAQRNAAKEFARRINALLEEAGDRGTSAAAIAKGWLDLVGTSTPPDRSPELLFQRLGRERAEEIADAALDLAPSTLGPLLLRAEVAEIAGDDITAVPLYEQVLELDDQPVHRWCYALSLQGCGRLADSMDVLEDLLRADPGDDSAHDAYRDVLREMDERLGSLDDEDPCPCGSGAFYEPCCMAREGAALERFEDRRVFDELREELSAYLSRPERTRLVLDALGEWLDEAGDDDDIETEPALAPDETQLFEEWVLAAGLVPIEDEDPEAATSLLATFAGDPGTAVDSARRALDWHEHCHYGLWVVEDPVARPTVSLREILTGRRMWVEMPPAQLKDRARWEVLLGYVVPIDGIWRAGGSFTPLTPAIGDEVARDALEIVESVALGLISESGGRPPRSLFPDDMFELPPSLRVGWEEPHPLPSYLIENIVRQAFPTLVREARRLSSRPISLQNMDGEPLELIKASISLEDPSRLRAAAPDHPDLEPYDDEIVWHGRELTPSERDQQLAILLEKGFEVHEMDDPGRWVRAHLSWAGDSLTAEVNSRERLAALLDLLERIAGGASIQEETTLDPSQDLPLPPSSAVSLRSVSPREDEAWRRAWVDEPVPSLSGMTPRAASRSKRGRILLEAMLRHFEYEADRTAAAGGTPRDIRALRTELGLSEPWSYIDRPV